jgi:hypothetical protein
MHLAGPTENGWRLIKVVPSEEQFEAFAREQAARPWRGGAHQLAAGVVPRTVGERLKGGRHVHRS